MTIGQRFTVLNSTYYIETIGPVTTLCKCEDGTYSHVNTDDLRRFLNTLESVESFGVSHE